MTSGWLACVLFLLRAWANHHGITAAATPVKPPKNGTLYGVDGVELVPASNERVISVDEVRDGVYQIALFQSRPGCVDKGKFSSCNPRMGTSITCECIPG